MAAAQSVVLILTVLVTSVASYLYNDGRDTHLKGVLHVAMAIGIVGTGLFIAAEALSRPASAVPECDWSNLGDDLRPECESTGEASRDAAIKSWLHFRSSYIVGPTVEFTGVAAGGMLGLLAASATGRRPSDGRDRQIFFD